MLRVEAIGIGLAEKTYERGIEFSRRAPGTQDPVWIARLERQIETALGWLEARETSRFFVAGRLSRADLAVAVATTYLGEKLPRLFDGSRFEALEKHRAYCEALPIFQAAAYSRSEARATGWRSE
jgi:glutathione S-transferase